MAPCSWCFHPPDPTPGTEVDVVVFDGTFGTNSECLGVPQAPPGIPTTIQWDDAGDISHWQ